MSDTSGTSTPPTSKKILIVDDDTAGCDMMAMALSSSGFQTLKAYTGERGLELYKQEQPHLILLDVALPGISGFEVATTIRQLEGQEKHTILVIITAYSQSFLVSSEFQAGIDSYLTKPVVLSDLVMQVSHLLADK